MVARGVEDFNVVCGEEGWVSDGWLGAEWK